MCRVMMSIAILCALTDAGVAQQPSSSPAFEAASVKPSTTGNPAWAVSYTADSLRATNATLSALIQSAYGVRPDRLVGGPNWVRTTRFDVNAKAAHALPREQLRRMAQRLLEDRFGLALTKERREQEAYVMRLARADGRLGPDVRRAADGCLDAVAPGGVPAIQAPGPPLQSSTGARPTFSGRCATIASVAEGLSRNLGIEVVDQTGLQGRWDYVIAYAPLTVDVPAAIEPAQASLPSVFVAVEEQLGFKLERNPHGSAEYVIIAKAHAPTEN
jgi:uncharacterized protein (TIGR03435 family)